MTDEHTREQAGRTYRRGLHILARSAGSRDGESLQLVARLWREALEAYRSISDTRKAKELEKSLSELYKNEYLKAHQEKAQRGGIVERFRDWLMFFKIGCLGFGGPMAVFSLLRDELVRQRKIMTDQDFLEGAVLGDVLPGPVTMDIVTYTGYKLKEWSGALTATLVFILPSFLMMLILAMLYGRYRVTASVKSLFACLGAAVTGLIVSVALKLAKDQVKDYREVCLLVWAFASALVFKLDIVVIVGLSGVIGMVLYHENPGEKEAE